MAYEKIQFNNQAAPGISAERLNHIQTQYDEAKAEVDAHKADVLQNGVHGIATTADLTLYVDAALGDDANTGLAAGAGFALKTIQAAINKIPQIVNHTVTVNVAAGTYAENVSIYGFVGKGVVTVVGGADITQAVNYLVNRFVVSQNHQVKIQGFKINASNGAGGGFNIQKCSMATLLFCINEQADTYGVVWGSSFGYMQNCVMSNHTTSGVLVNRGLLEIFDCWGSNNGLYGVFASDAGIASLTGVLAFGKRIRGNTANEAIGYGGQIIPTTTGGNVTLYVRPDGSDDNDGSANDAAHALRTIQEAIRRLPPRIDHTVTINIAAGTYNEDIRVEGFIGKGYIYIIGATTTADAVNYTANTLYTIRCSIYVWIRGLNLNSTTYHGIYLAESINVRIISCRVTGVSAAYAGINCEAGNYWVNDCVLSSRNYGILANYGARVYSDNNTGTGNTTGLYANRVSTIGKYGTQPGGTTAEGSAAGGVIR